VVLLSLLERRRQGGIALTRIGFLSQHRAFGAVLALSALLCSAGCKEGGGDGSTGISRETYIETYVEILRAASAAPDSFAATDSAHAILARRGLTEEDLLEFGRRYDDEPAYLSQVWGEIENRLREPEPADSVGDDEEGASEGGGESE
jgi:hypothetical protein